MRKLLFLLLLASVVSANLYAQKPPASNYDRYLMEEDEEDDIRDAVYHVYIGKFANSELWELNKLNDNSKVITKKLSDSTLVFKGPYKQETEAVKVWMGVTIDGFKDARIYRNEQNITPTVKGQVFSYQEAVTAGELAGLKPEKLSQIAAPKPVLAQTSPPPPAPVQATVPPVVSEQPIQQQPTTAPTTVFTPPPIPQTQPDTPIAAPAQDNTKVAAAPPTKPSQPAVAPAPAQNTPPIAAQQPPAGFTPPPIPQTQPDTPIAAPAQDNTKVAVAPPVKPSQPVVAPTPAQNTPPIVAQQPPAGFTPPPIPQTQPDTPIAAPTQDNTKVAAAPPIKPSQPVVAPAPAQNTPPIVAQQQTQKQTMDNRYNQPPATLPPPPITAPEPQAITLGSGSTTNSSAPQVIKPIIAKPSAIQPVPYRNSDAIVYIPPTSGQLDPMYSNPQLDLAKTESDMLAYNSRTGEVINNPTDIASTRSLAPRKMVVPERTCETRQLQFLQVVALPDLTLVHRFEQLSNDYNVLLFEDEKDKLFKLLIGPFETTGEAENAKRYINKQFGRQYHDAFVRPMCYDVGQLNTDLTQNGYTYMQLPILFPQK